MIDDGFLTDEQLEAYKLILAMDGPNPEIEQILLNDRAKRVAWKRINQEIEALGASRSTPTTHCPPAPTAPPSVASRTADAAAGPAHAEREPRRLTPTRLPLPDPQALQAATNSVRHRDTNELRDILARLVAALHPHAARKKPHEEVRKWIWAINTVMTERGEVPPCVRPQPKLGRLVSRSVMTESEKLMLNDRQMFDLEFAHKNRLGRPKPKWQALLGSDVFDASLAANFVQTVGHPEKKVDALGLRDDEQMQLASIRSEKIRKRWERIHKDAERLVDHLRAGVATGGSRIADQAIGLWREEYIALVVAAGSPARASALLRRFFAREKAANQLANRKRDLRGKGFPVD